MVALSLPAYATPSAFHGQVPKACRPTWSAVCIKKLSPSLAHACFLPLLALTIPGSEGLSADQERHLHEAFDLIDVDGNKRLDVTQARQALSALDAGLAGRYGMCVGG
eukprot:365907-Chlamydomonas_euryale.AAC.15